MHSESLNFLCFRNIKRKKNKIFAEESENKDLKSSSYEQKNSLEEVYKKMSSVLFLFIFPFKDLSLIVCGGERRMFR